LVGTLGFHSDIGKRFTIVDNDGTDPVSGTFNGLPQGTTLLIGSANFQITYHGGDGNDVVLTQLTLPQPPQMSGLTPLGNGSMQLSGTGIHGLTYTVQANDATRRTGSRSVPPSLSHLVAC
jgi:hypothetical protein